MVSYDGLNKILKDKGLTKTSRTEKIGISSRTIAKIGRGEKIAKKTMQKIADYLGYDVKEQ